MLQIPRIKINLAKFLEQLPENPGVYKFIDSKGHPAYIGKAKNLYDGIHKHIRNSDRPSLKAYSESNKRIYVSYKKIEPRKRLQKLESDELKKHTKISG